MAQKCLNCGTEYDNQATQTQMEICPTCTNTVYQNLAQDMARGGSWTGETGVEQVSNQTQGNTLQ